MGVDPNDRTISAARDTTVETQPQIDAMPLRSLEFSERYVPTSSLGQGGMGIVMSVRDEQIGREIAIKRLLTDRRDNPVINARFQREARVQAQLEHPSIVPVYDLGVDADGDAWFTMKKIRGATLAEIIAGLRAGDPEIVKKHTRRRLLTAFTNVCLAIDFAHAHGVVHRDLKPANVMLGDFGEVYVLDWGIAKITGVSDAELSANRPPSDSSNTEIGEVLGTVGYMPPEQLAGASSVTPSSDVWALGAMLFELLALEPLVRPTSLLEAIATADQPLDRAPSRRAPDREIPTALDRICERATAASPAERYPTARALHDDVMQFLDGDLELQRRRKRAQEHLARAREAEQLASGGAGTGAHRTLAMQEINKALALEPTNEAARQTMLRMIVEPPTTLPVEARAELERARTDELGTAMRVGAAGFLSMYLFLPIYLWMGIRDWTTTAVVMGLIATSAGLLWWGSVAPMRARTALLLSVVSAGTLIALLTRVVGPFASAPSLAFLMAVGLVFNSAGLGLKPIAVLVLVSLGIPLVLEATGTLAPSYIFDGGTVRLVPHMTELRPVPTMLALTLTSVSTIAFAAFYLTRVHSRLRATQEQLWHHSWNLRQFLPALPERMDQASPANCLRM